MLKPQNLWNPFRDWNDGDSDIPFICNRNGHKTSETLLGIETGWKNFSIAIFSTPQNLWNPFRDWNTLDTIREMLLESHKTSETLLGIETRVTANSRVSLMSCHKTSETLLGIETAVANCGDRLQRLYGHKTSETLLGIETTLRSGSALQASPQNLWNPFRDWNNANPYRFDRAVCHKTSETHLGIET